MDISKVSFTIRIDEEIHAKMKKMAKEECRSLNNMVEYALKNEIKKYEKENGEIKITDDEVYFS